MILDLNDAQLAVLRWIGEGCDLESIPSPSYKQTAVALRSRGLIELDRRRGSWHATLADKGSYYLEHGTHPDATRARSRSSQTRTAARDEGKTKPAPRPAADTGDHPEAAPEAQSPRSGAAVPIASQIRRPHAAMRELLDYKSRLDVPPDQLRRAQLILHSLIEAALRRGWTVTPVLSSMRQDTWTGKRSRVWPSQNLFTINAGHEEVAVRLRMKQRQIDHVPTKEEIASEERLGWRSYRKHDYVPTDRMRLEVEAGNYGSLVLEDTVATRVEDKLDRALERVQQRSEAAVARAEAERQHQLRAAEQARLAQIERERAAAYQRWREPLDGLVTEYARYDQVRALAARLRGELPSFEGHERYDDLVAYVDWIERHVRESDPLLSLEVPRGDPPAMSFAEWSSWAVRNPRRW